MAGSLEGVLANIPGLSGYLAQRQMNEAAPMQDLQQLGVLTQLQAQMAARQKAAQADALDRQMRSELSALGPNPDQSALMGIAAKYAPAKDILTSQTASLDRQAARDVANTNAQAARDQRLFELQQRGQQEIERIREQAAQQRITREEADRRESIMREQMARLAASLRPPQQPQPLVQIIGDNGQPQWVERSQAIGKTPAGAGSKAEATQAGKADVDRDVMKLKLMLDTLQTGGGIVDTNKGAISNIGAAIGSSGIGQTIGGAIGTKNQSARNEMNMIRPSLLRSIMQATGMSAKQMDSNAELKLWLSTATDPTKDYQANLEALNNIAEKYGSGGFLENSRSSGGPIKPPSPQQNSTPSPRPAGGRVVVDY